MIRIKLLIRPHNCYKVLSVRKIDDVEMKKACIETVADFYREGFDEKFAEEGLSEDAKYPCVL